MELSCQNSGVAVAEFLNYSGFDDLGILVPLGRTLPTWYINEQLRKMRAEQEANAAKPAVAGEQKITVDHEKFADRRRVAQGYDELLDGYYYELSNTQRHALYERLNWGRKRPKLAGGQTN